MQPSGARARPGCRFSILCSLQSRPDSENWLKICLNCLIFEGFKIHFEESQEQYEVESDTRPRPLLNLKSQWGKAISPKLRPVQPAKPSRVFIQLIAFLNFPIQRWFWFNGFGAFFRSDSNDNLHSKLWRIQVNLHQVGEHYSPSPPARASSDSWFFPRFSIRWRGVTSFEGIPSCKMIEKHLNEQRQG